jgi:hypothetical protein
MRNFKFEKESDNNWYVVLPEWEGAHSELQMVCGADTMLDIMAQGENVVHTSLSEKPFDGYTFLLTYDRDESEGGWYELTHVDNMFNFQVWLCHVTKFVFGYLPEKLYI